MPPSGFEARLPNSGSGFGRRFVGSCPGQGRCGRVSHLWRFRSILAQSSVAGKAAEGRRTPRRWRVCNGHRIARSVLECSSPLELCPGEPLYNTLPRIYPPLCRRISGKPAKAKENGRFAAGKHARMIGKSQPALRRLQHTERKL